jgi:hypothetical protein
MFRRGNAVKSIPFTAIAFVLFSVAFSWQAGGRDALALEKPRTLQVVPVGMSAEDFARAYPKDKARTYRRDASGEWLTFDERLAGAVPGLVSFHIQDGKVIEQKPNDRDELIVEYLGEFCSQTFVRGMPKVYSAIRDVLLRIPFNALLNVTDRKRPVLFTEFYDSGTARFANSAEISTEDGDAPCCAKGFTLIKLSTGLDQAGAQPAIEGIVAHELAHRILEHSRKGAGSCKAEREANALVKEWGFAKEFAEARKMFGSHPGDPASCKE